LVLHFGQTSENFYPARHLLNALAAALGDRVTRMPQSSLIGGGLTRFAGFAYSSIDGEVGRDLTPLQFPHESSRIINLVSAQRDSPPDDD
jgi:hypothetical protein